MMYTEVETIVSLEVCPDGGSLSVTFLDPKRVRHKLIFRIDENATEASEGIRVYKSALVESLITTDWKNPITCVVAPETVVRKTPVNWDSAAAILDNLRPLVANYESDYHWVYRCMEEVVSNERRAIKCSW